MAVVVVGIRVIDGAQQCLVAAIHCTAIEHQLRVDLFGETDRVLVAGLSGNRVDDVAEVNHELGVDGVAHLDHRLIAPHHQRVRRV